jgi:serine protease
MLMASAGRFPTTGGDNGDGSVVQQCQAPSTTVNQLQCYCNTSTCGAGMLDAGAAVASVSGPVARIVVGTPSPTAGSVVQLSGTTSLAASSNTITGYQWTLSDGGGIVAGFGSATNTSTATLTPSAAGSFTVTLTVTDSQGNSGVASQTVVVAAASVATPSAAGGGGGGGGALTLPWLALLALAVAALFRAAPAHKA